MQFGYRDACLRHDTGQRHPETADRLRAIRRGLSRKHGVKYVEASPASVEALEAVHDADYVARVREFCANGGGTWDADTVGVGDTWEAARVSAGLAIWAAEAALDGDEGRETPFALGRPPGHHATSADAMGFCFFNNVAVAAQAVLDSDAAERVAILDWDVHHGNGTAEMFADRGDVFYASIHERGLYPGTGAVEETGTGAGEGTMLNVPLPGGSGDAEYAMAFDEVVRPTLRRFDPDLVLVSAGFDPHRYDPISRMRVSTEGFGVLTARVRELCDDTDAALAFVLEGGYGLDALAESVAMVHDVFDGREPIGPTDEPSEEARAVVETAREAHGLE